MDATSEWMLLTIDQVLPGLMVVVAATEVVAAATVEVVVAMEEVVMEAVTKQRSFLW